jgi:hypothetical protein
MRRGRQGQHGILTEISDKAVTRDEKWMSWNREAVAAKSKEMDVR